MTPPLEDVLAQWRTDAAVLRRHGNVAQAALLERCADDAEASAPDWLTWLTETQALDRSAKSPDYFRARREAWRIDGYARQVGRRWQYRRCIVPRTRLASIVRAEAAEDVGRPVPPARSTPAPRRRPPPE
jgi:hypothetical protein